jgi:hypothetical protein
MPRSWISPVVSEAPGSRTFRAMDSISVRTRVLIAALGPITMSISLGFMHLLVSAAAAPDICAASMTSHRAWR